jgi:hypothetical protein
MNLEQAKELYKQTFPSINETLIKAWKTPIPLLGEDELIAIAHYDGYIQALQLTGQLEVNTQ